MAEPASAEPADPQHVLLERLLFFSDAVFAIVLTLLALELRLPGGTADAHLLDGLAEIKDEIIAFALSFAMVAVFWLAHLSIMRSVARFDWTVALANLLFLFTVTIMPFASTVVGIENIYGNAWRFYCLTMVAIAVAQGLLLILIHRDEPRLVHAAQHGRLLFRLTRASAPGIAFGIGFLISLAGFPIPASVCWLLVPVIMLGARWLQPKAAAAPAPAETA